MRTVNNGRIVRVCKNSFQVAYALKMLVSEAINAG